MDLHPNLSRRVGAGEIIRSGPYTTNEGGGLRPDYWPGNTALPQKETFRVSPPNWRIVR